LRSAARALIEAGGATDGPRGCHGAWLDAARSAALSATYCSVFFTDAGVLRTRLATNAAIKRHADIVEVLQGRPTAGMHARRHLSR